MLIEYKLILTNGQRKITSPATSNYYVWPLLYNYPIPFKVIIQEILVSRGFCVPETGKHLGIQVLNI